MHKSEYNQIVFHSPSGLWCLYNTYRGNFVRLTAEEKEVFEAYPNRLPDDALLEKLTECGALTDENEIDALRKECAVGVNQPNSLFLVICPTMDCNFACPYCVETGQRRHGIMDDETAYALKRFFDRMLDEKKVRSVCVLWYGGEPLLALPRMVDLGKHFLAACWARDIFYYSNITTNGYLLDENTINALDSIGVSFYRITLDGPAETHDKSRMLVNGKGTYDQIMRGVKELCKRKHQVEIRCNVSKRNADKLLPLEEEVNRLKEENNWIYLHYARMLVYRDVPDALSSIAMTEEEFSQFCTSKKDNKYDIRPRHKSVPCRACLPYSYCIDEDGDIYKCNAFLSQKDHVMGNVKDLPDSKSLDNSPEAEKIKSRAFPEDKECLSCKMLPQCLGSCPVGKAGEKRCHPLKNSLEQYVLQLADTAQAQ